MRCNIQEEPVVVLWVKERISHPGERATKAELFDGRVENTEERFDIDKNFSLVITDLEVPDEGRYYCQVVLKNTQIFENSTIMTVNCK